MYKVDSQNNIKNGFLLAGTKSGAGKTLVTLGILGALKKRGVAVQSFKCGPDFIDPTLHELMTGRTSYNLDLRMCGHSYCASQWDKHRQGMDITVIEGVMGLFDGGEASSAMLAQHLDVPVILIIDIRSAAESVAATLLGFETYIESINIFGVIFNFVGSARHEEIVREAVEKKCSSKILGFIPRNNDLKVAERHLGLHMGHEIDTKEQVDRIIHNIEKYVNIELLAETFSNRNSDKGNNKAGCNKTSKTDLYRPRKCAGKGSLRLAVARDRAFCFYYEDNLEIFQKAGIETVPFSPLNDNRLPNDINGIYLGGGYPELFCEKLAKNNCMKNEIQQCFNDNLPIFSECGGFMYLCKSIIDISGNEYQMADIFPFKIKMRERMSRLGYREVTLINDCLLGVAGESLYGHEFHYSEIIAEDMFGINKSQEKVAFQSNIGCQGYIKKKCFGSYVHFHFGKTPQAVEKICISMNETKG